MDIKKIKNFNSVKDLAIGMFYYTASSIIGPLVILGGVGYFLDKIFGTKPHFLIIGLSLAFIFSNIMLWKKLKDLNKIVATHSHKQAKENKDNNY